MVVLVGALVCAASRASAAPPTLTFTMTPATIASGGTATLTWSTTDADACTAAGAWAGARDPAGTEPVGPTITSTYRLDCTGPGGSVSKTLTLTVKGDECEQLLTCTITGAGSTCIYPFDVPAPGPGVVRITLKPADPSSLTPQWRLLTDTGAPADVCGTLLASTNRDCGPLAGGSYKLEVSASAGTGSMEVGIQGLSDCDSTRVDCDQVVTDEINPDIDVDMVRFSVADQEVVRVTIKPLSGALSPEWRVRRLNGTTAGSACDEFRRTVASDCGPLAAGDYQIQVKDEKRDATGTYALHFQRLTEGAACDSTQVFCPVTKGGEIDPGVDSDLFPFTVMDLERVHITIDSTGGGVAPEWRLLTAAGAPEDTCGSFKNVRSADCGPLAAGDYQIFVKDDTSSQVGTYDVTVIFLTRPCPTCGNGIVQAGEDCDPPGGCCSPQCKFVAANAVCRPSAGPCDLVEVCAGTSGTCPSDHVRPATDMFVCRNALDLCDVPETCDGHKAACPADGLRSFGFVCRGAAGDCDQAETCNGSSITCPPDVKRTSIERCRLAVGDCDVSEFCDGVSNDCPPDKLAPAGTVCRPKAHACDAAESCTGDSASCPPNLLIPGGCGNGCVEAGEVCGEATLAPCGAGLACVDCVCVACADPVLSCPAPAAESTSVQTEVTFSAPRPLGSYTVDLSWDPSLLQIQAIAGGTTPEFAADPTCAVDATAGTARCDAAQTLRTDGPTGSVSVARARFTALASLADRPMVSLAIVSLADPSGAPATLCAPGASCTVPECASDRDCPAVGTCSAPTCAHGACATRGLDGFEGADCVLGALLGDSVCGSEPFDLSLARLVDQRAKKARHLLVRAKAATGKKRVRLLHRVERILQGIVAKVEKGATARRTTRECADVLGQLLDRSRTLVAELGT